MQPWFAPGTGFELERSILTFTAQKWKPGESRPENITCSTIELPSRKWREGSDLNRQPRAEKRSSPDLTAWKFKWNLRRIASSDGTKMVGGTGFAPARAYAHEFLRLACMHSTTRRKTGALGEIRTLMSLRPPASRAGAYAVPPRPQKMDPARRLALRSSRYQRDASLPTLCRHGRDGRTCTFEVREDCAFTARCICCSATSRKLGARAGVAPA